MKVIVLLMCAVASTSAGNAVAWPGAIPLTRSEVKTIIPPQIQGFGYSSSQYINAIPSAPIGYHPQLSYQIPLPNYQPVVSASYYPNGFVYPSLVPAAPIAPGFPISPIGAINPVAPVAPSRPPAQSPGLTTEQPAGDEDTAVIESADSSSNQQQSSQPQLPPNFSQTSLDSKNMPQYPQIPGASQQFPFYPQIPQFIQPGFNFPPQQSGFQQNPSFPQESSPASSFPAADNTDKGLVDDDTVTVDSA
ncbi:protein transport protein sec31-like [Vanessa atalanta]|uniref:protein transport protein sec31-like n=1 Tax=Vanessa atalanta TaxID=42275 RepID=UPI001FCE0CD0|nr:protein transport protein sec31-like [Vanessa atalanta]